MLTRSQLATLPEPPDPVSDEVWLRSPAAFDAFTDPLLARLDDAAPDNGHGFGRLTPDGAGCKGSTR